MFDMLKLTFLTTLTPFRLEDDVVCLETSKTRYMQCTILSDKEQLARHRTLTTCRKFGIYFGFPSPYREPCLPVQTEKRNLEIPLKLMTSLSLPQPV